LLISTNVACREAKRSGSRRTAPRYQMTRKFPILKVEDAPTGCGVTIRYQPAGLAPGRAGASLFDCEYSASGKLRFLTLGGAEAAD